MKSRKTAAMGNEKARMEQAHRDDAAIDRIRRAEGKVPPGCAAHTVFDESCDDCIHGENHQSIARENQRSEDKEAAAFYFRTYHGITLDPDAVVQFINAARKVLRRNCTDADHQEADRLLHKLEGRTK